MTEWWSGLSFELQLFYAVGALALAITLVQLLLMLIGLGGDSLDLDTADNKGAGVGIFSSQTLSAFFLGFGWVGAMVRNAGVGLWLSLFIAILLGLLLMAAMYFGIKALLSFQSSGNINYASAVGEEAVVYVTLPGDGQDGGGQIQVMLQGRLRVAGARKTSPGPAAPGSKVRITGMDSNTSFRVEPL